MKFLILFGCTLFLSGPSYAQTDSFEAWAKNQAEEFKHLDLDKNGEWSLGEYMHSLDLALGPEGLSDEKVREIKESAKGVFLRVDLDKNGVVSVDEFTSNEIFEEMLKEKLSAGNK